MCEIKFWIIYDKLPSITGKMTENYEIFQWISGIFRTEFWIIDVKLSSVAGEITVNY